MHPRIKKIARVLGWLVGGLLLVLCLAVAGVLVWLRTDYGERTVAGIAKNVLAGQGLFLSMDAMDGPLPSRILLKNVRLADAEGEWFAAKELEVSLNLFALLGKTATVTLARVETPQLFRLPTLPPAAEPVPEEPAGTGYFNLPIGVNLEELVINDMEIFAPLLFPDGAGAAAAPASPLFTANLRGHAEAPAGQALEAKVTATAAVADMDGLVARTGPLPVSGFSMDLDASASVGATIAAVLNGTLTPAMEGAPYPFTYGIEAQLAGMKAVLERLALNGAGLALQARGGADLDRMALNAEADLATESGGAWEGVVQKLAGRNIGGGLVATLKATLAENKDVTAAVDLSGRDMRWGMDQLQDILGQRFTVKAEASGNEATAFALTLHTLEAGAVSASGTASYGPETGTIGADLKAAITDLAPFLPPAADSPAATDPTRLPGPAGLEGALRARLNASGTLDAPAASFAITSDSIRHPAASVNDLNATGNLSGTLEAPVARVAITAGSLTAAAAAVQGLRAEANLSGTLASPVFSLVATGADIRTGAGAFTRLRVGVDGTAALPETGDKTVAAQAAVTLEDSPAGPVALRTALEAAQKPSGAATARLHGLDLALAGTDLAADITAAIPPAGSNAMPSVTGKASATVTDWKPIAALSGVAISGSRAELEATFSHEANVQEVNATVRADALSLPDAFALNGLAGSLQARDIANPDIALSLTVGKGEAGPVAWQTGAVAVNAQKGDGTFAAALRTDKTASSALASAARQQPAQPGRAEVLTAAGSFSLEPMRVTLDRLAGRVPQSSLGVYLTQPAAVTLGDATTVKGLNLAVVPGKGNVALDAHLAADRADLTATVTEFPLRLIRDAAGVPAPDGTLSAEAALKKTGASVQGAVNARALLTAPAVGDAKTPPVSFSLASILDGTPDPNFPQLRSGGGVTRLKGSLAIGTGGTAGTGGTGGTGGMDGVGGPVNGAALPAVQQNGSGTASGAPDAQIHFNVPLRFAASGIPEPAMQQQLGARVAWRGELAPLWALVPMQDRNLSGLAQVDAEVTGPMANPEYTVAAYVANGRFEDNIYGVLLTDIALQADTASSGESKLVMRAEDGAGGYAALEGALSSPRAGDGEASPAPRLTARGQINHLQPLHRDDLFLRLSGRMSVDGPLTDLDVVADVEVERGELSIANLRSGVRTLDITDPAAENQEASAGPRLDVTVSVPHKFYIRGRGLDSEWAGDLAVAGTASDPILTGSLRPVRGTFNLLSRDFEFSEGDISFFGGARIDPALNLALTYDGPNITAIVRAHGTASKPEIVMESDPSLPQDQILAEVLFGKEFSQLSRFEALQVANSLRQLANIGGEGLDPLATMRTKLGIDMLRVGSTGGDGADNRSVAGAPDATTVGGGSTPSNGGNGSDSASTPTLEAGKYINDAIYVGVEQGATSDSTGVRVEVELRPNLSLQGKTTSQSSEVGLGWKKDY